MGAMNRMAIVSQSEAGSERWATRCLRGGSSSQACGMARPMRSIAMRPARRPDPSASDEIGRRASRSFVEPRRVRACPATGIDSSPLLSIAGGAMDDRLRRCDGCQSLSPHRRRDGTGSGGRRRVQGCIVPGPKGTRTPAAYLELGMSNWPCLRRTESAAWSMPTHTDQSCDTYLGADLAVAALTTRCFRLRPGQTCTSSADESHALTRGSPRPLLSTAIDGVRSRGTDCLKASAQSPHRE